MRFNVVLLEGVFAGPHLSTQGGTLADALTPLLGERVRIAAHHLPSTPIDPTRWGGGSCTYQPGPCPFGHHLNPTNMYSFSEEGILGKKDQEWTLTRFNGTVISLAFDALAGHQSRIACAPVVDIDTMRDSLAASGIDPGIGVTIDNLRATLNRLRGI